MQRLEVSGAVRHICMSLGVKGLNNVIHTISMKCTMQNIQASRINNRILGYLYANVGYPENTLYFVVIYL
jgi:hypothetical protein